MTNIQTTGLHVNWYIYLHNSMHAKQAWSFNEPKRALFTDQQL